MSCFPFSLLEKKNTFSYSSNGIIISFKDGFEKSTQHISFIRFYVVESFSRDFGLFIFQEKLIMFC